PKISTSSTMESQDADTCTTKPALQHYRSILGNTNEAATHNNSLLRGAQQNVSGFEPNLATSLTGQTTSTA
ncbi:hypothetical protein NDU88_004806, partial [Pleurodeles waltl]